MVPTCAQSCAREEAALAQHPGAAPSRTEPASRVPRAPPGSERFGWACSTWPDRTAAELLGIGDVSANRVCHSPSGEGLAWVACLCCWRVARAHELEILGRRPTGRAGRRLHVDPTILPTSLHHVHFLVLMEHAVLPAQSSPRRSYRWDYALARPSQTWFPRGSHPRFGLAPKVPSSP